MTKNQKLSNQNDQEEYVKYLLTIDEVAVVLKSHLKLEQKIDRALEEILPKPNTVLEWSFLDKILILDALGIISESLSKNLKEFNTLRNKFSHRYGYKLSLTDLKFLENVDNVALIIPENLKNIPNIRNIILIARAGAYLGGWLTGIVDVKKISQLRK